MEQQTVVKKWVARNRSKRWQDTLSQNAHWSAETLRLSCPCSSSPESNVEVEIADARTSSSREPKLIDDGAIEACGTSFKVRVREQRYGASVYLLKGACVNNSQSETTRALKGYILRPVVKSARMRSFSESCWAEYTSNHAI